MDENKLTQTNRLPALLTVLFLCVLILLGLRFSLFSKFPQYWENLKKLYLDTRLAVNPNEPKEATPSTQPDEVKPVTDYQSLIEKLKTYGVSVIPMSETSQPYFNAKGWSVSIANEEVQVFEFDTAEAARQSFDSISADGSKIGGYTLNWNGEVRIYQKEKLIVIYVGDNVKVMSVLSNALGNQTKGVIPDTNFK